MDSVEFFIFDCDGARAAPCALRPKRSPATLRAAPMRTRSTRRGAACVGYCARRHTAACRCRSGRVLSAPVRPLAPPPRALRPGVIWKGDTLIDGVPETLDYLRSKARAARALLPRRCAGSGLRARDR